MEAAEVFNLPDRSRPRGIDKNGELAAWMPKNYEEALDMLQGVMARNSWLEGRETRRKRDEEREEAARFERAQIMEVLVHWRDLCAKKPELTKLVPNSPRWMRVKKRLSEGWTVEDLKHVVDYCVTDEFLNGSHPKAEGKSYLGAETLFRDSDQVEKRLGQWDDGLEQRVKAALVPHMPEFVEAIEAAGRQERELHVLAHLDATVFEIEQRLPKDGAA